MACELGDGSPAPTNKDALMFWLPVGFGGLLLLGFVAATALGYLKF